MKIKGIEFPGSYIISKEQSSEMLTDFLEYKINDYHIYYSTDMYYDVYKACHNEIFLIGYCFDIRNGELSQKEILENLLSSVNLINDLEFINGRYIIFINKNNQLNIFTDASQLQPLVYHSPSSNLASHDQLLAQYLTEKGLEVKQREDMENHSELDYTRYYNIYKYNPSLKLDTASFKFERIYPRTTLPTRDTSDIFEEILPYLKESVKWLKNNKQRKFLTITAGIDSRVSASLVRTLDDVEYLTYITPQSKLSTKMAKIIYRTDNFITQSMKDNLGWKHDIINIFDYRPVEENYQQLFKILNSRHSLGLRKYYEIEKKYNHALHIKSTVFGMGKADFKKNLDKHEDSLDFYDRCVHGIPGKLENRPDYKEILRQYYTRNLIDSGVTKGRHFFDLFHLESRMGNWHSTLTLETDPQTDEFIFTNARKLIDLIQQPSIKERRNYDLYKRIINEFWPVLLHFGINKQKNLYEQSQNEKIINSNIEIEVNDLLTLNSSNNQYIIKPKNAPIKFQDVFQIKVKSNFKDENLKIRSTYNNPKGIGLIKVIVRNANQQEIFDITKLNKGIDLIVNEDGATIIILYSKTYINKSWRDAGELIIET